MRFECPNCGCLNEISPKNDRMHIIINEFKEETNVSLCSIVDEESFIIISETNNNITKPLEKKIVAFYIALRDLSSQHSELINFQQKIETFSLITDLDPALDGFQLIIKSIEKSLVLLTLLPGNLNIAEVIPKFEKTVQKLSNLTLENNPINHFESTFINVKG